MCNSDTFKQPLKNTFGGNARDHLKGLHQRMTPIGLPNPTHLDYVKKKSKKVDSGPFGGYVSAYDQKTALGA